MAKDYNPIEEEVRDIIGIIPPKVVKYGSVVILSILTLLTGICCIIPCKETEEIEVRLQKMNNGYLAEGKAPTTGYGNLYIGQPVQITVDCFPSSQYGFMEGSICMLDTLMTDNGYKIRIYIPFQQSSFHSENRLQEMPGKAFIIIRKYRLIEKLFNYS